MITDWLQNRLLGSILSDIGDLKRAHRALEARVSAVSDVIRQFRADVDAETNRIGDQLADMQRRLDEGDASTAASISGELGAVVENLRAIGSGGDADPVPAPEVPGEGEAGGGA
jgi:hypothetical protein